jgi:hypothetical protein
MPRHALEPWEVDSEREEGVHGVVLAGMREEGDEDDLLRSFGRRGKWAGPGRGLGRAGGLLVGCHG